MKKAVIGIVVLVVLIGGGILLGSKLNNKSTSTMDMPMSHSSSTTTASTNSVTIENFAFSPASISVKKGTTVTWTNKDSTEHTVTETDGAAGPKSDNLGTNKTYSFTFDTAGTFHYHCSIHPDMKGTVTVTQ